MDAAVGPHTDEEEEEAEEEEEHRCGEATQWETSSSSSSSGECVPPSLPSRVLESRYNTDVAQMCHICVCVC